MIDKEKVIEGLRFTTAMMLFNPITGNDKQPSDLNEDDRTTYDACVGAIELLREQEAVTPQSFDERHKIERNHMELRVWRCGYCTTSLDITDNFCRNCGKKVDWK